MHTYGKALKVLTTADQKLKIRVDVALEDM